MSNAVPPQIDYTSRDYDSLRADLVRMVRARTGLNWSADDPSDIGVALLEAFAYMGDVSSYYIDRAANENFIDTATQRQTLLNMAAMFDYRPSGPTPAVVGVTFTNVGVDPIDIPAGTQVIAPLQYGEYTEVFFETATAASALAPGASITITCNEGKTANTDRPGLIDPMTHTPLPVNLGSSTGVPNMEKTLPDAGIVDGSVHAYIGQGDAFTEWGWVDALIEWGPYDQVFTTQVNADGTSSIVFGDGVNGAIPANGQMVSSSYKVSTGAAGNISAGQIVEVSFIPGNVDHNAPSYLTVSNPLPGTGGADADDNLQMRAKLKKSIAARRRAITLADYEALALLVPHMGRAQASATVSTAVTLHVQPQDDGTISPGIDFATGSATSVMTDLQSATSNYMADKIPVGTSLTVLPPTYVDLDVEINISVSAAYKQAEVLRAVAYALLDSNSGLYSYYTYGFGSRVPLSDLIFASASVPGVVSVTVVKLAKHGATTAADVLLADGELPRVLASNLTINAIGGLV